VYISSQAAIRSGHSQRGLVAAGHAVTFVAQRGESDGGLMRRVPVARWVACDPSKAVRERPV
jgi:hypothetical protein